MRLNTATDTNLERQVPMAFVGHANPQIADFRSLYLTHMVLALITAALCLRIDTAPTRR